MSDSEEMTVDPSTDPDPPQDEDTMEEDESKAENEIEREDGEDKEDRDSEGKDPEEEEEEEKIPEAPLTQEIVNECISLLCKIGNGLAHAYVRLDVKERELTDISMLSTFIHLRYVDVSSNSIKNISALNNLHHLLTLKAEKNLLASAQLDELPYLQTASFAFNKISNTDGIEHPLLESLNLSHNQITRVTLDPSKLSMLHTLELRNNKLTSTEGIILPTLKNLYLAQNQINSLKDLEQLTNLHLLHLRENQLDNFEGFTANLKSLQYINVRGNLIQNKKEVTKLRVLPMLKALVMSDCPISDEDDYRIEVLITLRRIDRLDKDEYTDDERQEAEEIYEQRRLENQTDDPDNLRLLNTSEGSLYQNEEEGDDSQY